MPLSVAGRAPVMIARIAVLKKMASFIVDEAAASGRCDCGECVGLVDAMKVRVKLERGRSGEKLVSNSRTSICLEELGKIG